MSPIKTTSMKLAFLFLNLAVPLVHAYYEPASFILKTQHPGIVAPDDVVLGCIQDVSDVIYSALIISSSCLLTEYDTLSQYSIEVTAQGSSTRPNANDCITLGDGVVNHRLVNTSAPPVPAQLGLAKLYGYDGCSPAGWCVVPVTPVTVNASSPVMPNSPSTSNTSNTSNTAKASNVPINSSRSSSYKSPDASGSPWALSGLVITAMLLM